MKKYVLIVAMFLLCGCSNQTDNDELLISTSVPISAEQQPEQPRQPARQSDASQAASSQTSVPDALTNHIEFQITSQLKEGYTIIAAQKDNWEEAKAVYLYVNEPIYDVLISRVYGQDKEKLADLLEVEGLMYVPELDVRQAIEFYDPYSDIYEDECYYTKIAYTNSEGKYETVLVLGENDDPQFILTESSLSGSIFDQDYQYIVGIELPEDLIKPYIPNGLCIVGGSLGDVNSDGIEDVLLCLASDGKRVAAYSGIMPLFVLIGQPDGGYVVDKKNSDALFMPIRSCSYPVAGSGYIDLVYDYVGGAACHHTQRARFLYNPTSQDWFLSGFLYQPTMSFDYSEKTTLNFVRPLPEFTNLALGNFKGEEFYQSTPDWDYFDVVSELVVPSWGEFHDVYTLAIKLNDSEQCYEGYIYRYFESVDDGGFIQTICGEYKPDTQLKIIVNEEERSFMFQNEIWSMDEHDEDSFLMNQFD